MEYALYCGDQCLELVQTLTAFQLPVTIFTMNGSIFTLQVNL